MPSGFVRALFKSRMTSDGGVLRISVERRIGGAREADRNAQLVGGGLDFRGEHQIVENG